MSYPNIQKIGSKLSSNVGKVTIVLADFGMVTIVSAFILLQDNRLSQKQKIFNSL